MTKFSAGNENIFDDNYADGKAAEIWNIFIGDVNDRLSSYKDALCSLLRKSGAKRVLDLACGTGPDSVMLIEEGFQVTSIDASDKMLKHALQKRWDKRKEKGFDNWEIREANWQTLPEGISDLLNGGFDAAICLGNSFSHVVDMIGDNSEQRKALINFKKCLKPGGLLIIDHRNYDDYPQGGLEPSKSIYYHIQGKTDIKTEFVKGPSGKPQYILYSYTVEPEESNSKIKTPERAKFSFRLYPHALKSFLTLLKESFDGDSHHSLYGDYKPIEENSSPGYFIHTITRGMRTE